MCELIPSLLVQSKEEFDQKLRLIDSHVKTVHIDIMDGTFVPHVSWHDPQVIGDIKTSVNYEIHLMVENPLPYIEAWKKHVPNLVRAIIHAEIDRQLEAIIEPIHQWHKLEASVALNPETPFHEIRKHLPAIQSILVMGVHPGASRAPFEGEYILDKIHEIHHLAPSIPIGCDGGITLENAKIIKESGCSSLICANAIFGAQNPIQTIEQLKNVLS